MLKKPEEKYGHHHPFLLTSPHWVAVEHPKLPEWCSIDLRDGNQALPEPMGPKEKQQFFDLLVRIGFREIEVGFPNASTIERTFIRSLIEGNRIPDGVSIQGLARCTDEDFDVTFATLAGARRATVHFYLATAPFMRHEVLRMSEDDQVERVRYFAQRYLELAQAHPETVWTPEFSPEMFTQTEPAHALRLVNAVVEALAPSCPRIIINLPATVEMCLPHEYANLIEWMHTNIVCRNQVVLSAHVHNDRGTATATAELALCAGAERVEGCLFGNGERAGNLDIFMLAMNFYVHGVSPGLDFSELDSAIEIYENCTGMTVHPRHPYAGSLAFTAFSGTHQDAIYKNMRNRTSDGAWRVAYNNLDPEDIGRTFKAVGVTSQSGSGGIAYLLERSSGIALPKPMQKEFARIVQRRIEVSDVGEYGPDDILKMFVEEYLDGAAARFVLRSCDSVSRDGKFTATVSLVDRGEEKMLVGKGNGHLDALIHALRSVVPDIEIVDYSEQSLSTGSQAEAFALVELSLGGNHVYGCGRSTDTVDASYRAVISALNRNEK